MKYSCFGFDEISVSMSVSRMSRLIVLLCFIGFSLAQETGLKKLINFEGIKFSGKCDCTDWYGRCRRRGDTWTDEGTWMYACDDTRG